MNESLSLKEAAALVGVHPQTLRRWIRQPGNTFPLPYTENGMKIRYWKHEIEAWLHRPREERQK